MANSRLIGSLLVLGVAYALTAEGCSCGGSGSKTPSVPPLLPGPATWYSQYRQPTSSNLRAVRAADPNTVIVAGEATSIFRSDDAGQNWVQLEHRPGSRGGDVASMDFSGANLVCAGSDSMFPADGRIWTATNGVLDFTTPDLNATVAAYVCVNVVSSDTYYALRSDGVVEKNVGGMVTTSFAAPVSGGPWYAIHFFGTTDSGVIVGSSYNIRTMAAGGPWSALATVTFTAPNTWALRKVWFTDPNTGYACGDNVSILKTVDGGSTWTQQEGGTADISGRALHSIHFPVDANHGWAVGDKGLIAFTTDGSTWNAQASQVTQNLYDVWFSDNNDGYAVGDDGIVLRTVTAGVLSGAAGSGWLRAPPAAGSTDSLIQLNAVDFSNDGSLGLVAGNSGLLLRTLDGGSTWVSMGSLGTAQNLQSVAIPKGGAATGNVAYACGAGGVVVRSANILAATPTWTAATPGGANTLNAILFPADDDHGVVCGAGSTLLATADGTHWTALVTAPATSAATWLSLSADPGGANLFVGGTAGISATSTDLGVHWANQTVVGGGAPSLNAFQSPAGAVLFAGGSDNHVWKGNGAAAWTSGGPPAGTSILGLSFTDTLNGWLVNSPAPFTGGVFTTPDATTWSQVYLHTKWQLSGVWASPVTPGLVYVVGQNGTILKTTTGGQ